jgi:cyclin B
MNNLNRRALGDIGNKIAPAAVSQPFGIIDKKLQLKTTTTTTVTQRQTAPHLTTTTVSTEKTVSIKAHLQEPVQEIVDANVSLNESEDEDISDIVDIDELDGDNSQLAAEYVKDIYNYLNQMEKRFRVSSSFLDGKIVTTKMRAVLIDWLLQVHSKFHLLQETMYLCVQIIDAYLELQDVPKMHLQLVGVTALFLAAKYEEMYVPTIDDFVYMTDHTYTKGDIKQMEINILKTLGFMLGKPLPLHFLRRFSKAGQADPKQHTLAKYFMELSLHDSEFSSFDPSYLAACSLFLSFKILNGSDWNRTLEFYSTYKRTSLLPGMQKIGKLVIKANDADYKYRSAVLKYASPKQMRISTLTELQGPLLRELVATLG